MHVEFPGRAESGGLRGLLLSAVRAADDDEAGRAGGAAAESAGRPGPAAADVPGRLARGRRGMRVRAERRVRPVPADHQPSHESAARSRAGRPGEAGRVGVLPRPAAGPGRDRRPDRLHAAVTTRGRDGYSSRRVLTSIWTGKGSLTLSVWPARAVVC